MWDTSSSTDGVMSVSLLACRMTSATLVYSAGNIAVPQSGSESYSVSRVANEKSNAQDLDDPKSSKAAYRYEKASELESPALTYDAPAIDYLAAGRGDVEKDQCRLYYYEFDLSTRTSNSIAHQWALSVIPFEFPSVRPDREMQSARYVYGCSTSSSSFGAALGRAVKIDVLAKIDAETLIERGKKMGLSEVTGCVDNRSVQEILNGRQGNADGQAPDPIQLFQLPPSHFAQEPRFIPRAESLEEDAGFLLFYVFDESQLLPSGECDPSAVSELWILDAQNMRDVLAKIRLPQRVPYGLHGTWFSEENIEGQRAVDCIRSLEDVKRKKEAWAIHGTRAKQLWMKARDWMERAAG